MDLQFFKWKKLLLIARRSPDRLAEGGNCNGEFWIELSFLANRSNSSVNSAVLQNGLLDALSSAAVAISGAIYSEYKHVFTVPIIYITYVWIDLLGGVNIFTFNVNVGGALMAAFIHRFS